MLGNMEILGVVYIVPRFALAHAKSARAENWMFPGEHRACRSLTFAQFTNHSRALPNTSASATPQWLSLSLLSQYT